MIQLKRHILIISIFILSLGSVIAQMKIGNDTLYGNEWILPNATYAKIDIAQDGLYQINFAGLARVFGNSILGSEIQLWQNGKQVPIYITNNGAWNANDKFLFYGYKNRSETDQYLFQNPLQEMLNPEYSLWSDTTSYFIALNSSSSNSRISLRNSNLTLPASNSFQVEQLVEFHSTPIVKYYDSGNEITYSSYDECEGFGNKPSREFSLNLEAIDAFISSAANAKLTIRLAGLNLSHRFEIRINENLVLTDSFFSYQMRQYALSIANADLHKPISIGIKGTAPGNDQFSISTIKLEYPKKSGGKLGENEYPKGIEPSVVSVKDLSNNHVLISPTSIEWIQVTANAFMEVPSGSRLVIADISSPNSIQTITSIKHAPINNLTDADYFIVYHAHLSTIASEYAQYRSSTSGGNFKVQLVDIQQIYDQYGYGIKSVLALRNFGQHVRKINSSLQYMLLMGRALNYRDRRIDNNAITYKNLDLIPSFGFPGGDNLIFAAPGKNVPNILLGRIAASTTDQARNYFNKVKEYESKLKNPSSNDDLYWRKEILHLAGGSPSEGFDLILDRLKSLIINTPLKPNVLTVKKNSSDPVQGGPSNIVINKLNQGVAIHTYLGHGAISATEIGLDDPEIFNNVGKYPIAFTLGCNSGNIHTTGYSLSESFLFSKKGDIIYLSSSSIGTDNGYNNYGLQLYPLMGDKMYTSSISAQHYKALEEFEKLYRDPFSISLVQQFAVHGDPAIRLNYFDAPDYTIDGASFKTTTQNLQIDQDSIRMQFNLWNLGRISNESVPYEIQHILPSGQINIYNHQIIFTSSSSTVFFSVPMPESALGNHIFKIKIDPKNIFSEKPTPFAESNNDLRINNMEGIQVSIFDDAVTIASPLDLSIVGKAPLELLAYTTNAFSNPIAYTFEIDTTALFNSPIKEKQVVVQRGGLISYKPNIRLTNETVYYWRIAADTLVTKKPLFWSSASFVYLTDKGPGWNQSHAFQFLQTTPNQDLKYNLSSRKWTLKPESVSIVASSINHGLDPAEYSKVLVNGGRASRNNRTTDAEFMVSIWDTVVGNLLFNTLEGRDGSTNAFGNRIVQVFTFPMDKNTIQERANLIRFLETGIKPGQYVILNNHIEPGKSYFPQDWFNDSITLGKNLFSVLEKRGARQIRDLAKLQSYPYLFIYREGGPVIDEQISTDGLQVRSAFELNKVRTSGMSQVQLKPNIQSWDRIEWSKKDIRNSKDVLTVLGQNGIIIDTLITTNDTVISLRQIDANKYPSLLLKWTVMDTLKTQDLNLTKWRVYYKGLPDLAIQTPSNFSLSDTIDQNDGYLLKYSIRNIGSESVDSFYTIHVYTNSVTNATSMDTVNSSRLDPGSSIVIDKNISTSGKEGLQSIGASVRSRSVLPEITLKNNTGKLNYFIQKDFISPTVQVLINGRQILNNDIIPKKPQIQIHIKDNKDFAQNDSNQITLSIKYPDKNNFELIPTKEYVITKSGTELNIDYQPLFIKSGNYTLRVIGKDRSGNSAGRDPYEIQFRVITENAISAVLPYPNPFTTECKFAYTLTGEVPEIFKIQIMTVSGRIVRELTDLDLGSLQEGTHLTERSWDGRDENGNTLATGTYLYRVIAKNKERKSYSEYESLPESEGDGNARKFITKGLGKIVILR